MTIPVILDKQHLCVVIVVAVKSKTKQNKKTNKVIEWDVTILIESKVEQQQQQRIWSWKKGPYKNNNNMEMFDKCTLNHLTVISQYYSL